MKNIKKGIFISIKPEFTKKIEKGEKLDNTIYLKDLKNKFGFAAPQSYAYDTRYSELEDYINTLSKRVVVDDEI